jgi:6-phosphofructokinase 2
MILTVTPNPAVDKSTRTDRLIPEKKLRCAEMVVEAGGGGINVSKALQRLGTPHSALITCEGFNGSQLEACLQREEIHYHKVMIPGETRENLVVLEEQTNNQFRFVLPGPTLQADIETAILDTVQQLPIKPRIIVGSGSLPPGFHENFYARLAALANQMGAKPIIDCSGKALELAVEAGVYLVKPNLNELSQLVGASSLETDQVVDAAQVLLKKGSCKMVVVSLGAQGALLVSPEQVIQVPAPTVKKQSTVGAGDSMVAGMSYQIWKNSSAADIIRFGVACGTAATMNPGTQLFNPKDADRLYGWLVKQT